MQLEFHQLDRGLAHLRVRRPDRQRRLLASLAGSGQQVPIVVVAVGNEPDRYRVIDGYKRVAALEQLGRDTVEATVWPMTEVEALVLDRSIRFSEADTALEQGWLLVELEHRFGYSLDELARRFDRSVSWVSRRLALVELLPEAVQEKVRHGDIAAHVAMKFLVPVARANIPDCKRMAEAFAAHRFHTRDAGQLYAAWRDSPPSIRGRILDDPQLFLKAHRQTVPDPPSAAPGAELLRDLDMVRAIAARARRRLAGAATVMAPAQLNQASETIERALEDLQRMALRILKEGDHVEPSSENGDSGIARQGCEETPDRAHTGSFTPERAPRPAVELFGSATVVASRESRTPPGADLGTVGRLQRESRPGP